jgi:hydroxylaminobenzene mutase
LLLIGLLIGFIIPALAVPRLGVSAHVNAVVGALFLLVLGLIWPQLRLGARAQGLAFWFALYSFFMGALMPLLAGAWRAGGTMLPLAAGTARGSVLEEGVIAVGLTTAGATVIALCLLLFRGLRGGTREV